MNSNYLLKTKLSTDFGKKTKTSIMLKTGEPSRFNLESKMFISNVKRSAIIDFSKNRVIRMDIKGDWRSTKRISKRLILLVGKSCSQLIDIVEKKVIFRLSVRFYRPLTKVLRLANGTILVYIQPGNLIKIEIVNNKVSSYYFTGDANLYPNELFYDKEFKQILLMKTESVGIRVKRVISSFISLNELNSITNTNNKENSIIEMISQYGMIVGKAKLRKIKTNFDLGYNGHYNDRAYTPSVFYIGNGKFNVFYNEFFGEMDLNGEHEDTLTSVNNLSYNIEARLAYHHETHTLSNRIYFNDSIVKVRENCYLWRHKESVYVLDFNVCYVQRLLTVPERHYVFEHSRGNLVFIPIMFFKSETDPLKGFRFHEYYDPIKCTRIYELLPFSIRIMSSNILIN